MTRRTRRHTEVASRRISSFALSLKSGRKPPASVRMVSRVVVLVVVVVVVVVFVVVVVVVAVVVV